MAPDAPMAGMLDVGSMRSMVRPPAIPDSK